jgi:general L-amino acid transport system permease protein
MATTARVTAPMPFARTARRWSRENLFGSPANTVLTIVSALIVGFALFSALRFVFVSADWEVIEVNRRLFFLGRFPSNETWRVWSILFLASGLTGLSFGLWGTIGWRLASAAVIALVPLLLFTGGGEVALLTVGTLAVLGLGYGVGRTWLVEASRVGLARNLTVAAWLISFPLAMYLLSAVDSLLWGGFLLTMILTIVGIVASFPIGVLAAVGRASSYPVIRLFCIGYIELIRGVPLITVLFMAKFFLPLMVEPERGLPLFAGIEIPVTGVGLDDVTRAMVAITLFSGAYVAETVRGGLQAVPKGQIEAAQALGLGTTRILGLIVLPQALRAVIPALVGQFISLFKDTSLVVIVGLTELLKSAQQVTAQPAFIGKQAEALLFAALIYWIVAFSMSRASQRLERTLGVGER